MKRKLAVWLNWKNFSEYHSRQMASAVADKYDTTITFRPLNWNEYDVVLCFFPGPNRNPDCLQGKIVKFVWEPHEYGWAEDAGVVLTASMQVYERVRDKYKHRLRYLPWGINPDHFYPQLFPSTEPTIGWAGSYENPRKRFGELSAEMAKLDGFHFMPNVTWMRAGTQLGKYDLPGINEYYKSIHVYVCGSHGEGFGFPLLEASACGRAVVTFDLGCAMDLQKSGAGVTIVNDWTEMRNAIREIDCHIEGCKSARAVNLRWTWDALKDKWLDVLDSAG